MPESWQIPSAARAIIAARVDRLEPADKRLLQAASIIGKDVPLPLLEAVAEVPAEEMYRQLARLQAAEFLYEARLFPEAEYTFKHALTHEVTYESLLNERRRTLHATIMEAIEAAHFEHALTALERLPRTDANLGHAIDILMAFRTPLYVMGDMDTLGRHLAATRPGAAGPRPGWPAISTRWADHTSRFVWRKRISPSSKLYPMLTSS
jgi:hypothetical protein